MTQPIKRKVHGKVMTVRQAPAVKPRELKAAMKRLGHLVGDDVEPDNRAHFVAKCHGFTFHGRPGETMEELADRAEATILAQFRPPVPLAIYRVDAP